MKQGRALSFRLYTTTHLSAFHAAVTSKLKRCLRRVQTTDTSTTNTAYSDLLDEALGELDLFDARVADSRDLKLCRERGRQDATSAHPAVFMNATGWVAGLLIPLARQLVGGQQTSQ